MPFDTDTSRLDPIAHAIVFEVDQQLGMNGVARIVKGWFGFSYIAQRFTEQPIYVANLDGVKITSPS